MPEMVMSEIRIEMYDNRHWLSMCHCRALSSFPVQMPCLYFTFCKTECFHCNGDHINNYGGI